MFDPVSAYARFLVLNNLAKGTAFISYVPFLLSRGVPLPEILLIQSFFMFTIFCMEIPTGMFADGKTRSFSLLLGVCLMVVSDLLYIPVQGTLSVLPGEFFGAVGATFLSGAQEAWFVDALKSSGSFDRLKEHSARVIGRSQLAMLIGIFLGTFIGMYSYTMVFVVCASFYALNAFNVYRTMMHTGDAPKEERLRSTEALRASINALRKSHALKWLTVSMWCGSVTMLFLYYWVPFFTPKVPYWSLGMFFVLFMMPALAARKLLTRPPLNKIPDLTAYVLMAIIAGVSLTLIGLSPGLVLPIIFILLHFTVMGMFAPLYQSLVQSRIESGYRATFTSLQSVVNTLGFAIITGVVWLLTRDTPVNEEFIGTIWTWSGIFLVIAASVLWFVRPRTATLPSVIHNQEREVQHARTTT